MLTCSRKQVDSNDASKGREYVEYCNVTSLLAFDGSLEIHGREGREANDEAVGDLEKGRDELRVSEAFYDKGAEIAH